MIQIRALFVAAAAFWISDPAYAQDDTSRGMIMCSLGVRSIVPANQRVPDRPNLAILIEDRFEELSSDRQSAFPVRKTADADNLLGGADFQTIRMEEEGGYSIQTSDEDGELWDLVLRHAEGDRLPDGFFMAGLGNLRGSRQLSYVGHCGFLQMANAEAVFDAHPPVPSN